jgi:hypothetical protein
MKSMLISLMITLVIVASAQAKTKNYNETKSSKKTNDLETIVTKIHILESSQGKHNFPKCKSKGLYNEYGFGTYGKNYKCFQKGMDREAVKDWFKDKLDTQSVSQAVCLYNEGAKKKDCPYYREFLSI